MPLTRVLINIIILNLNLPLHTSHQNNEIFKTDIGNQMTIGLSNKYKSVKLRCNSNSMEVEVETEEDFSGVIYTRGSFYKKNSACFLDTENTAGKTFFSLKFFLSECSIQRNGDVYSSTLILQHDKELIMPGDAAFHLECDFSKHKDITVTASLQHDESVTSRIALTNADPSILQTYSSNAPAVENKTNSVTLKKIQLKENRDEL